MGTWPPPIDNPTVEYIGVEQREGIAQHKITVQISAHDTAAGYLLIPPGEGKRAAVLVVFYEGETGIGRPAIAKPNGADFAWQLTRRGFVTLSIGTPNARGDPLDPKIQQLSFLAYAASNCYNALAHLKEVDPARIGVIGHSYGSKWAMFASCLDDRFAAAVWCDGGIVFDETRPNVNYWEPWYLGYDPGKNRKPGVPTADNPRTGAYQRIVADGHDLVEVMALMAPRPFLVSGGSEDPIERWLALNQIVAVNTLLGYKNRVGMTTRPDHRSTDKDKEVMYAFFEHFLDAPAKR
jgi:dienelactone hydrolase